MSNKISRIQEVDIRDIFKIEARDFTPWLAENLDQLSERLGIEVVDPEVEKQVGDFRLDIIGIDANSTDIVAIENQLDPSDHNHLGQLITYASGIEAGIVVWITPEIRQEHQQALSWLNENSDTSFFGVELRAIRIGDSEPAIDFRIKVAPNDWSRGLRTGRRSKQVSPRYEQYRDFFDELSTRYWSRKPGSKKPKARPQHWYQFGGGKSGIYIGWAFRMGKRFSAEVYIDASDDPDQNVDYMNQLRDLTKITDQAPDLEWEDLPEKRACRIVFYRPGDIDSVNQDSNHKEVLISWGIEKLAWLEKTFRNPIKELKP